MVDIICSFCGQPFKSDMTGQADYMQVRKMELMPARWTQGSSFENLFMCFSCFQKMLENIAFNAANAGMVKYGTDKP